jgi:hypothetical protein
MKYGNELKSAEFQTPGPSVPRFEEEEFSPIDVSICICQ